MVITEQELIIPALELVKEHPNGLTTSDLIYLLRKKLHPTGRDIEILVGRNDDVFSQKVRNLISHKSITPYVDSYKGRMIINRNGMSLLNRKTLFDVNKLKNHYSHENNGADANTDSGGNSNEIDVYSAEIENNDDFREENPGYKPIDKTLEPENIYLSVSDLKRKYDRGKNENPENALILSPEYQRESNIWNNKNKSLLIESLILNIPIPSIYLSEDSKGNLIVIDGKQRLSTLFDFIDDKFKLTDLPMLTELEGCKFSQLTGEKEKYRVKIEDRSLHISKLRYGTDDAFVIETFERVNTKGVKLNAQEVRNAMYQGKSTKLLDDISKHYEGDNQIIDKKRMKDKYIVLRYFAMQRYYNLLCNGKNVGFKTISNYLSETMKWINHLSDDEVKILQNNFIENYDRAKSVFNQIAFRFNEKHPINMILFEITLIIVNELKTKTDKEIIGAYLKYLQWNDSDNKDPETTFSKNIKYHRDSKDNIEERLLFIKKIVRD